jgi:hypothetical protein
LLSKSLQASSVDFGGVTTPLNSPAQAGMASRATGISTFSNLLSDIARNTKSNGKSDRKAISVKPIVHHFHISGSLNWSLKSNLSFTRCGHSSKLPASQRAVMHEMPAWPGI